MSRLIRFLAALGMGAASTVALALPPFAYDQWSVTNGNIDASGAGTPCQNGITSGLGMTTNGADTCSNIVSDNGMLYQLVETQVGSTTYQFLRMILTDPNATGTAGTLPFATETIIPWATTGSGGAKQGITAKQVVRDTASGLEQVALLQRGANPTWDPSMRILDPATGGIISDPEQMYNIDLTQTLNATGSGSSISSTFSYRNWTDVSSAGFTPDGNTVVGHRLNMAQDVVFDTASPAGNKQRFDFRETGGWKGYGLWPGATNAPVYGTKGGTYSMTLGGTTVSWQAGTSGSGGFWWSGSDPTADTVRSTWIGQNILAVNPFGHQSVEVLPNTVTGTTYQKAQVQGDLTDTGPFAWEPTTLGTQPVF